MRFVSSSLGRAVMGAMPLLLGASLTMACGEGDDPRDDDEPNVSAARADIAPRPAGEAREPAEPRCVVEDEAGSCRLERCALSAAPSAAPADDPDLEPVLSDLEVPPLPVIDAPAEDVVSHARSRDLVIAWKPVRGADTVRVLLTNEPDVVARTDAGRPPRFEYGITCEVPVEDGAVAIPTRLLSSFPETDLDPVLRAIARENYTLDDDGLDVTFNVGWYALTPTGREFERTLKLE